jgi:hypothetical protein
MIPGVSGISFVPEETLFIKLHFRFEEISLLLIRGIKGDIMVVGAFQIVGQLLGINNQRILFRQIGHVVGIQADVVLGSEEPNYDNGEQQKEPGPPSYDDPGDPT